MLVSQLLGLMSLLYALTRRQDSWEFHVLWSHLLLFVVLKLHLSKSYLQFNDKSIVTQTLLLLLRKEIRNAAGQLTLCLTRVRLVNLGDVVVMSTAQAIFLILMY